MLNSQFSLESHKARENYLPNYHIYRRAPSLSNQSALMLLPAIPNRSPRPTTNNTTFLTTVHATPATKRLFTRLLRLATFSNVPKKGEKVRLY